MPIYEYECGVCKLCFERKQRFDEEPGAVCPECQGKARRVFHPAPIIFRGSGFYITDSRKGDGNGSDKKKEPEKDKKVLPTEKSVKEKALESTAAESDISFGKH